MTTTAGGARREGGDAEPGAGRDVRTEPLSTLSKAERGIRLVARPRSQTPVEPKRAFGVSVAAQVGHGRPRGYFVREQVLAESMSCCYTSRRGLS